MIFFESSSRLSFCEHDLFRKNRYPLFRIMLQRGGPRGYCPVRELPPPRLSIIRMKSMESGDLLSIVILGQETKG